MTTILILLTIPLVFLALAVYAHCRKLKDYYDGRNYWQ